MINHARTLLLNRSGDARPAPSYFAEEFVEPTFRAIELPSYLVNAQRALFGSNPDNAGKNLMLWQYMKILDSTEFVSYVEALDSRITYRSDKSLLDESYGVQVDANSSALDFTGQPDLGGTTGQLIASWLIERTGPTSFSITNTVTGVVKNVSVTFTDGISEFVTMPGQRGYKVRFLEGNIVNDVWTVTYLGQAQSALDPINRLTAFSSLTDSVLAEIFPSRSPYKLFKRLFQQHDLFPYKMSGALLAVIYRTEEVRLGA